MTSVLYFGCWDRAGHYLHDTRGHVREHPLGAKLDGGFVPDGASSGPEGVVRVTYAPGCTILGFRDSSVDSRAGSHSTFVLDARLPYGEALDAARAAFPFVFDRLEARGVHIVREARGS